MPEGASTLPGRGQWFERPEAARALPFAAHVYQRNVADGHLLAIVAREARSPTSRIKWHLSLSHRSNTILNKHGGPAPGRLPTWDEIKDARYRFLPTDLTVAQLLPPPEDYVNAHPTCLHLWEVNPDA